MFADPTRVLSLSLLCALSPAQGDPAPVLSRSAAAQRVPLHSHPDDPTLGAYGVWGGGRDYKASFGGGIAFHPLLGKAYSHNLPLAWQTESVRVGGRELLDAGAGAQLVTGTWRHEVHRGAIAESYDVLADGLEQSFVLAECPGSGDLVVTGRVETELRASACAPRPGAVVFHGSSGEPLVRYGEAHAFDAEGRHTEVATGFDGERLVLVVPGAWLAEARFPVTVDPLLQAVLINAPLLTGGYPMWDIDIGFDPGAKTSNTLISLTRWASATDSDVVAYLCNQDFSNAQLVFTDMIASLGSSSSNVAFNTAAARWAIGFERDAGTVSQVRIWVHDRGNTTLNSGSMMYLPLTAAGTTDRHPDIGGYVAIGGPGSVPSCLCVYQTDVTSNNSETSASEVRGVWVNLATKTFGAPFLLAPATMNLDREQPAITQFSDGAAASPNWVVVWQEYENRIVSDDWQIRGVLVNYTQGVMTPTVLTTGSSTPKHRLHPQVSGNDGRYMTTYVLADSWSSDGTGSKVAATRFDWAYVAATPSVLATGVIGTQPAGYGPLYGPKIAADTLTNSHWLIGYNATPAASTIPPTLPLSLLKRVGGQLQTLENASITPGTQIAVTSDFQSGYLIAYQFAEIAWILYGQRMVPPPDAQNVPYGVGCGGSISASAPPLLGSEQFTVFLKGAPASTAAALLLGFAPAAIPLSSIGMTGCFLDVAQVPFTFNVTTSAAGEALHVMGLPNLPLDLYFQWAFLKPGANPLGVLATGGLKTQAR